MVRQFTGRTVVDYINQMLLMEASFLLQNSTMSITQIADRLHFVDTPSFSKFFAERSGRAERQSQAASRLLLKAEGGESEGI